MEPEHNLKYSVRWDKRDVYGQKVYGRYVIRNTWVENTNFNISLIERYLNSVWMNSFIFQVLGYSKGWIWIHWLFKPYYICWKISNKWIQLMDWRFSWILTRCSPQVKIAILDNHFKVKISALIWEENKIFIKLYFRFEPRSKVLYLGSGQVVHLKDTNLVHQGTLEKRPMKTVIDENSFGEKLDGK